ncbi:MAG: Ig-like domain-containing protein [Burkholderiales bacterium]|nr:Ig-like domain-containing protein [Burkholderiales bacterium]
MNSRTKLYSWLLASAALLAACGGGGSAPYVPLVASLTLSGTAASGLAIAGATITAKCQTGSGSATTLADGSYQLVISGGVLPCMLEVSNPADSSKLHSVASGSGIAATANITPLTEMLTARVLGSEPVTFFAAFDATTASRTITTATVQAAQADVALVLAGTVDTSSIGSFVSTAFRPATAANTAGGDTQDKLLDTLKTKLNATQLTQVVTALAQTSSTSTVKQMVVDRVAANQTQLTSTVNLSTNTVLLQWSDSFPAGTSYRIEAQNADGSFSLVETVSGVGGSGTAMQWQRAVTVSSVYRVVAVLPASSVTISTAQGQSSVSVSVPPSPPTIVLDQTEPASGSVKLSLSSTTAYTGVTWYTDLRLIGSGTGVGNPVTWNTATETNGSHLILAKIQVAPDSYTEVRRTVSVSNSNIAVNAGVSGTTGTINVDVTASSQFGIARVEAVFDGVSIGSLTTPNACSSRMGCGSTNNVFRFSINASTAGSGSHTMLVTATDSANNSKSTTVQVPISNLPGLTVTSPADGAFVTGTLNLSGSYSTDKAGVVTVLASLGDYQFMSSTSATFNGTMSLAGLTPGSYTLTVRATDSSNAVTVIQRTVTVTSNPAAAYTPNFTLGANGQLIANDDSNPALVLYKADDGSYRVRNTTAGTEVTLQGASGIPFLYNWAMDGGYVFVEGGYLGLTTAGYTECPLDCIYQWTPAGVKSNLSNTSPNSPSSRVGGGYAYEQYPRAHNGYVLWIDYSGANPGTYTMYKVATGVFTTINQPSGANYMGNTSYDFAVVNGAVNFFYWAQTGGEGMTSTFDVYKWSSATNTSTKLSGGGARNIYPQTDGQTVAWLQTPIGGATTCNGVAVPCSAGSTILSMPAAGGTASTVSSTASESFQLHDGVLTWLETTSTSKALKALVNGATSTVSSVTSSVLYGTGGGFVVFGELGKTYSWNAKTKSSTLLIDAAPNQVLLSGSTLYFVMGASKAVYRVGLN